MPNANLFHPRVGYSDLAGASFLLPEPFRKLLADGEQFLLRAIKAFCV